MHTLLSSGLLSAALALGQTSSVPAPPTLPPQVVQPQAQPQRGPIMSWFTREDRPVLSRISGWFKRDSAETPAQPTKGIFRRDPAPTTTTIPPLPMSTAPTPGSNDFPRRLPNPTSKAPVQADVIILESHVTTKTLETPTGIQQTAAKSSDAIKAAKYPIVPALVNKIGRDEKFAWITGQLEMENGGFVLYYATPETVDRFHGKIVLQPQDVDMKALRRGDLVSAQGQLVQRPTLQGLQPAYRATAVTLVDRPKQ